MRGIVVTSYELHNLSTPCQPRPLIYEREGCFVNAGECVGRVHKRSLKIATTRFLSPGFEAACPVRFTGNTHQLRQKRLKQTVRTLARQ